MTETEDHGRSSVGTRRAGPVPREAPGRDRGRAAAGDRLAVPAGDQA